MVSAWKKMLAGFYLFKDEETETFFFLLRLTDESRIRILQFLSGCDKIILSGQEVSSNGSRIVIC